MTPQQQTIEIEYINRPEVSETFADLLERVTVDGATNTLRMEFCSCAIAEQALRTKETIVPQRLNAALDVHG